MKKKIMVVDDEFSICDILKKYFIPKGYEVIVETDSTKALETVNAEKPDCVLLDVKMPKVNGIDLLEHIKKLRPNLPVVMITGYGTLEDAVESMKLGAVDYITKPFDLDFIGNVVKKSLGE